MSALPTALMDDKPTLQPPKPLLAFPWRTLLSRHAVKSWIYKRDRRIFIVFWCNWCAGLFCIVSARAYMAGVEWVHKLLVKWRHQRVTILQLSSLSHTSDFILLILKNIMCWQQHPPGNSLERIVTQSIKAPELTFRKQEWRIGISEGYLLALHHLFY